VTAGAVPACVQILQEGPDDTKDAAAWALACISVHNTNISVLVAAGAVPACLQMIAEDHPGQESAALLLGGIAGSEDHKQLVQEAAATCVAMLRDPDAEWQGEQWKGTFLGSYEALVQLAGS